ncbi:MAG TPA: tetratricopeptide repeat protein, partial [Archaeoglobus sp.]|nr:tetratricopeptide repeat protein [Archaeoglobus sp.]
LFEKNGEDFSVARAENNQAYVEARMGKYADAYSKIKKALELRQKIGDFDGYALSLTVQGFIEDRMGMYPAALQHAREAKAIIKSVFPTRIIRSYLYAGLVEARALRHSAQKRVETSDVAFDYLDDAYDVLKEIMEHEDMLEPYYQWEVYNELGQVFSRRAGLMGRWELLKMKEDKEKFLNHLKEADKFFRRADEIANKARLINEIMDNCDDWSWVFITKLENYDAIKDLEKAEPSYYYRKAKETLEKGMKQIEINGVTLIRIREESPPPGSPRYYEGFYWLGSLYFTKAHLTMHYADKFDEQLKERLKDEKLKKTEVIKYLLKANVLYDLFTDQPLERLSDARTWLIGELEEIGHTREVEEILKEAIRYLKETFGTAVKVDKTKLSKYKDELEKKGFLLDEERGFIFLRLSEPVEKWDEAAQLLGIFSGLLNKVKEAHTQLLKNLPVWREISAKFPRIDLIKLLEEA